jgi:hypothetical protein
MSLSDINFPTLLASFIKSLASIYYGVRRNMMPLSVHLPEIVIPSADANASLSRFYKTVVHLPESFRGGCSFGTDCPVLPPFRYTIDASVVLFKANVI